MFPHEPGRGARHHHDPRRDPRRADGLQYAVREMLGRGRGRPIVRRGEIRPLILALLQQRPMHGYEIIQQLEEQSGGRWRPSAGSVYPALQLLADQGLVTSEDVDGRRTYTLTPAGRAAADAATPTSFPWEGGDRRDDDLRALGVRLVHAVVQVQNAGSPHARTETRQILDDARRRIYRLLADDEALPSDEDDASTDRG